MNPRNLSAFVTTHTLERDIAADAIIGVSAMGAVMFNVGQILMAVLMLNTPQLIVYYLPVLMVSGVLTGILTGVIAQMVMKHLKHMKQ